MTVVAIVPAKDRADSVAATVRALRSVAAVDRVLVVDDGSTDDTTTVARGAGAEVLRLPRNRGKGGAVRAGAEATPGADVYLLIDADIADTAATADVLLRPVLDGEADMTIGVLPPAAGRGGFGRVRDLARRGIRRACGLETQAPLSGQRAVRGHLLRDLPASERFGLEVALTIDAVRAGARVREVDVQMDHRHTGRSAAGFAHRARQGADIVRSLWPRLTSRRVRVGLIATSLLLALIATFLGARFTTPTSVATDQGAQQVILFGIPRLGLDDLDGGRLPTLDGLVIDGALAASSVRTDRARPSTTEAYATISAGTRVRGVDEGDRAYGAEAEVEGVTAREVAQRRTGRTPRGEVVVVGGAAQIQGGGDDVSSAPGALGRALRQAGRTSAVVGNGDTLDDRGERVVHRPAALAAMDRTTSVDIGSVDEDLLMADPVAPFGRRTDPGRFGAQVRRAMAGADFVVIDPGETDRAAAYAEQASAGQEERLRVQALRWTDDLLAQVVDDLPADALLLVVGVTPPTRDWALTPIVAYGAGVTPGHLPSLSTKRPDLTTITDVPSTVLEALDVPEPDGMIGQPLRYRTGEVQVGDLKRTNDIAAGREGIYYPMALTFIVVQALVYLIVILALTVTGVPSRLARPAGGRPDLRRLAGGHLPLSHRPLPHDHRQRRPPAHVAARPGHRAGSQPSPGPPARSTGAHRRPHGHRARGRHRHRGQPPDGQRPRLLTPHGGPVHRIREHGLRRARRHRSRVRRGPRRSQPSSGRGRPRGRGPAGPRGGG
ncbi:MAG: glycosyltransferase [Acidimicrobiales bacterium]